MRLQCPFCGDRDIGEFVHRGDAALSRPVADADERYFAGYVYIRDNPAGPMRELWYHAQGCRNWLIVSRNTITHAIVRACLACEA